MILIKAKFESLKELQTKTNLIFSTQDLIAEYDLEQLLRMDGYLAFNPDEFRAKVLNIISAKRIGVNDEDLTFSERLRKVLWLVAEEKAEDFEKFYAKEMERIIEHYKAKYL
jgi:hypothetical protein